MKNPFIFIILVLFSFLSLPSYAGKKGTTKISCPHVDVEIIKKDGQKKKIYKKRKTLCTSIFGVRQHHTKAHKKVAEACSCGRTLEKLEKLEKNKKIKSDTDVRRSRYWNLYRQKNIYAQMTAITNVEQANQILPQITSAQPCSPSSEPYHQYIHNPYSIFFESLNQFSVQQASSSASAHSHALTTTHNASNPFPYIGELPPINEYEMTDEEVNEVFEMEAAATRNHSPSYQHKLTEEKLRESFKTPNFDHFLLEDDNKHLNFPNSF